MHRRFFRSRSLAVAALASVLLLMTPQPAFAASGDPDGSFATDGEAEFDFGADEVAQAVVQGPGGKLYLGGNIDQFFFSLRITPGGDEDGGYGTGGWAGLIVGESAGAHDLAVGADGSAFVVGVRAVGGVSKGAVVKFDPDGQPDESFSGDGLALVTDGAKEITLNAAVLQPDGKIVVAGQVQDGGAASHFLLARLRANGTLDPTFGDGGRARVTFGPNANAPLSMLRQPDGKILVAGETSQIGVSGAYDAAFARFKPDGTLDRTFGAQGKTVLTLIEGGRNGVLGMALAPGGKPLACIEGRDNDGHPHVALARLTPNGKADTTFGGGDGDTIVTSIGQGQCSDVAVQGDGKPVVAGALTGGDRFSAVRFQANGKVDRSFSIDGIAHAFTGAPATSPNSVIVQGNGRIVVAGFVNFGNKDVAVARFLP
jgi:uncharacterized delta-60 repeat protein